MKGLRPAVALLLLAALFAGCVQQDTTVTPPVDTVGSHLLLAGPALWSDPQNAPHPAYGWATLSNPPAGPNVPHWWQPINATPLPAHITGLEHIAQAKDVPQGAGIAIFGRIAVVPEDAANVRFVDISDPSNPVVLGKVESSGRGAAIIAYPDGRLVTAVATSPGFDVIEFTDPTHPVKLSEVQPSQGGHKLGIVPGTPILYNAASNGGSKTPALGPDACNADVSKCTGYTEIYDLTDPSAPVLVQEFPNGLSCHHIFFWNSADGNKSRALCAGIQYTQIWDTKDPLHPSVIVSLPVHAGVPGSPSPANYGAFSHSAGLSMDGSILYVGDESGGGGVPPGCVASANIPVAGSAATPVGATWFYDVSDEANPRPLGYYSAPIQPGTYVDSSGNVHSVSCTTHHGRLIPDLEHRDLLAMSYYGDGVIVLDFTGIGTPGGPLPHVVAQFADGSDTWETWYDQGYLFTGDLARGMDTFKLT